MQAGIAHYGRTFLAALTAALMVFSLMAVFADTADANHEPPDDTYESVGGDGSNEGDFWETYLANERDITDATCWKYTEVQSSDAFVMPAEPDGEDWVLLVVKQATTNYLYYDPVAGHTYPSTGDNAPGYSHIIVCSVAEPEPGQIIVEKEVTEGSDTSVAFTFNTTGFTLDDNTLADGESGSSGDVAAGDGYSVSEVVPTGWTLDSGTCDDGSPITNIDVGEGETVTCTFVNDQDEVLPEVGEIIVQKVVLDGSTTFEFTFDTVGFTLADDTLAHGQSSSSGDVAVGDGYSVSEQTPPGWTLVGATCDDGSLVTNIDVSAGETVTCTFTNTVPTEVQASILVQVEGTCVEDDGEGEGVIDVNISVDEGAEVVVRDSDGDVVGTFTSDGSVTVPEGATYTWQATPNEGFEFPEGAATSGTITIETCSDLETLPFTGLDLDTMAAYAAALMAAGAAMLLTMRKAEAS